MKRSTYKHYLFDWGNTLMADFPSEEGPMYQWQHVEAVDGAKNLLRDLSNFASCHLATNAKNSTVADIKKALLRVELDTFIKKIFCFRGIGYEKPSKEFFNHILTSLDCEKNEIIMIGDNLEQDVYGALNAGIDAIWFNPQNQPVPYGIKAITSLNLII